MATLRLTQPENEPAPPNTFGDFHWIRENEATLLEKYGEGFILVYNKAVIGFGPTYQAAVEAAERNLPPGPGEITPVIDTLYHRHPFTRIVSTTLSISLDDLRDER